MPKGADNETLIIDAARMLFLGDGHATTSMDAVARAAGVSKATVYAHFASKDDLFIAVVEREGEAPMIALRSSGAGDTARALRQFGRDAAALLLSPSTIGFQRVVASEVNRSPAVGRLFYANGPDRLIGQLAAFLRLAMRRGDLRTAPPRLAAVQFLAIIVGDLQLRALMGVADEPEPIKRQKVIASGIDAFLRAYAPAATGSGSR